MSIILLSWAKCLSLAGCYSRAEFALKAVATPLLYDKGLLAACSLGNTVQADLVSRSVFGVSLPLQAASEIVSSRPGSSLRALRSSRSRTPGAGEASIRRPVSGKLDVAADFVAYPAVGDASDHPIAAELGLVNPAVHCMSLQEDDGQDAPEDIVFHNAQSEHPQFKSWVDVAVGAAGPRCQCRIPAVFLTFGHQPAGLRHYL